MLPFTFCEEKNQTNNNSTAFSRSAHVSYTVVNVFSFTANRFHRILHGRNSVAHLIRIRNNCLTRRPSCEPLWEQALACQHTRLATDLNPCGRRHFFFTNVNVIKQDEQITVISSSSHCVPGERRVLVQRKINNVSTFNSRLAIT